MQDLPENHFRVSGASWVNIINLIQFNSIQGHYRVKTRKTGCLSHHFFQLITKKGTLEISDREKTFPEVANMEPQKLYKFC